MMVLLYLTKRKNHPKQLRLYVQLMINVNYMRKEDVYVEVLIFFLGIIVNLVK